MGIVIQTGGGAGQLGAGLGAGFAGGVAEQQAQKREDELTASRRAYEQGVREEAMAFDAEQASLANVRRQQNTMLADRLDANQWTREQQQGEIDRKQGVVREADAASRVAGTRIGILAEGRLAQEGESPSPRQIEDAALFDMVRGNMSPSAGMGEVATHLHDLETELARRDEERDATDMLTSAQMLGTPDESGRAFFDEAALARLEAASQGGDTAKFKAQYAQEWQMAEAVEKRLGMNEGLIGYGLQRLADFQGAVPTDQELVPWHASVSRQAERFVQRQAKLFEGMGPDFPADVALQGLERILTQEDPKTIEGRKEAERVAELEAKVAAYEAEAAAKGRWGIAKDANSAQDAQDRIDVANKGAGSPAAPPGAGNMTIDQATLEVERLLEAGEDAKADALLKQIEAAEAQNGGTQ